MRRPYTFESRLYHLSVRTDIPMAVDPRAEAISPTCGAQFEASGCLPQPRARSR